MIRLLAGQNSRREQGENHCGNRYGSFEFLIMLFSLTNAPAKFCRLMNYVLYDFLEKFVVVYLDDIVLCSESFEDHVVHLWAVFSKLREHELYIKKEKCEFCREHITFFGLAVSNGQILKDKKKVVAIIDWAMPRKVAELRSFLGLANYYRRFIKGYSRMIAPLTDLLKKERPVS